MDELTLARVVHLLGVALWIGGVSMITTIEFFSASRTLRYLGAFTTLITGWSSGFYIVHILDA